MGLLFAIIAMFSWGIGDFLIQKNARQFGDWLTMFFISIFGAAVLLPFVWREIPALFSGPNITNLAILTTAGILMLIAGLLEFQALKVGKISVIEPIFTIEVLITIPLSIFILKENISAWQIILICALMSGIVLISLKKIRGEKENIFVKIAKFLKIIRPQTLEQGVLLAIFASALMGAVNFTVGVGARATSALMMTWFFNIFITIICLIFMLFTFKPKQVTAYWRGHKKLIFSMAFFDNLAWLAYAVSMTKLPVAIATGFAESYILIAASLGFIINKEKLKSHQIFGFFLAFTSAVILALTVK